MGKLKNNEAGLGAVEAVLILVIVAMIGFVGWYVFKSLKNTNNAYGSATTTSNSKSPKFSKATTPSLTLDQATKQTQTVYDALVKSQDTAGTPPTPNKRWDYNFINAHKTWFTQTFMDTTNAVSNSSSTPDYSLICVSGSAELNTVTASSVSLDGKVAKVKITESVGPSKDTSISLPVTLAQSNGTWVIDSVDLGSCPQ